MARTFVYIDGFNLYYRALRGSAHRWLDLAALSRAILPPPHQIGRICYYTARVSGKIDPTAPARQQVYLKALSSLSSVEVHFGKFLISEKWAGLVHPARFRPPCVLPPGATPDVVWVRKTEEKGSDVNLSVHLVRDAFQGLFDEAAVLTNDTDLVEPLRIVTQELHLPVTLLTPEARPAVSLAKVSTSVRHIVPHLHACHFPDPVTVPGKGLVAKPPAW